MQTSFQGEVCTEPPTRLCTELHACTVFLPSEAILIKKFLESYLTNGTEAFPIQLELCSYIPINIFTNQSEEFHSNQSGKCPFHHLNFKDLGFSSAWGWTDQGPGSETSVYISQLPFDSDSALSLSTEDCVSLSELKHWRRPRVEQARPAWSRPARSRSEHSCLAREGPGLKAIPHPCCFTSHAIS